MIVVVVTVGRQLGGAGKNHRQTPADRQADRGEDYKPTEQTYDRPLEDHGL